MKEILTVSQLNGIIKGSLESDFGPIWVEGEVSNLRKPSSGHIYFTLKDEKSQIRAVIFRTIIWPGHRSGRNAQAFDLQEGTSILCRARLSVYIERGEYQLIVDTVEPRGLGALQLAFEQLKARLEAEGLFLTIHKKSIPFFPRLVGVITSASGAVIKDILQITRRRCPSMNILLAPCRVQGLEAPEEIIKALANLQAIDDVEVIIIARGGGSLEDLAPFNDEKVARAIFACTIPVLSAVGHETDFTIADFVSDLRAPTPSAAAELVSPLKRELAATLLNLKWRLAGSWKRHISQLEEKRVQLLVRLRDPRRLLAERRFTVDDRLERIKNNWLGKDVSLKLNLNNLKLRIHHCSPLISIRSHHKTIEDLKKNMLTIIRSGMVLRQQTWRMTLSLLDQLNPLAVLKRGYSIARTEPDRIVIKDVNLLNRETMVSVEVSRGSFKAQVWEINREE